VSKSDNVPRDDGLVSRVARGGGNVSLPYNGAIEERGASANVLARDHGNKEDGEADSNPKRNATTRLSPLNQLPSISVCRSSTSISDIDSTVYDSDHTCPS
jgi:hypothetical protein